MILLVITILVPVLWVFVASVKQNSEFYGSPWALPEGLYFQNFVDAWQTANMGEYMLNSVLVTAMALVLLIVIALPASYVLARFKFKSRGFWNTLFMAGFFIHMYYILGPLFLSLDNGGMGLLEAFEKKFFFKKFFLSGLGVVFF